MKYRETSTTLVAVTAILLAVVAVYYVIDPEKSLFMPKCQFYLLTGYKCPLCGMQRFLHHLLHGEVLEAVRYNYFLALCLPYAALCALAYKVRIVRSALPFCSLKISKAKWFALALCCLWWVLRNVVGL